jgi:hypothetical protein
VSTVAVDGIIAKVLAEYSTSKVGLSHAIKHFAVHLVTEGIDCYEVRPGMMKTSMTRTSQEKYDTLIASRFVPAHRWGELSDIGEMIANLADGAMRSGRRSILMVGWLSRRFEMPDVRTHPNEGYNPPPAPSRRIIRTVTPNFYPVLSSFPGLALP